SDGPLRAGRGGTDAVDLRKKRTHAAHGTRGCGRDADPSHTSSEWGDGDRKTGRRDTECGCHGRETARESASARRGHTRAGRLSQEQMQDTPATGRGRDTPSNSGT